MSERPHVPALPPPPIGTSQIGTAVPPARSTRFNFSKVKKAIERPSGDHRIELAPSVPGIGLAEPADNGRTQTRPPPFRSHATYASCEPSGETARKLPSAWKPNSPFSGRRMENRTVDSGGRPRVLPRTRAIAAIAAHAAAAAQGGHPARRRGMAAAPGSTRATEPLAPIERSCNSTSCADCQRSAGSLARQVRTRRSSSGGLRGCCSETGGGSVVRIAEMSAAWLAPEKALAPVSIS